MDRNVRFLMILSCLLLLQNIAFSQKILEYEFNPPNAGWSNFLLKGGEASQETLSMLFDRNGFIWSGTESGLYRFDGFSYVEYGVKKEGREGFIGYGVFDIFEDSEGTIWAGTSEAVNRLDQGTGTFRSYVPDSSADDGISNFIRTIREDRSGLLWIFTSKDIFSFDKQKEKFTRYAVDPLSWYKQNSLFWYEEQCFAEDHKGNKWFVTNHGLYLLDIEEQIFRMVLPDSSNTDLAGFEKVYCVTTDSTGSVWIGTRGCGLLKWDYNEKRPVSINIKSLHANNGEFNSVSNILPVSDSILWCFGNEAFSKYNTATNQVENYVFEYKNRTVYESPGSEIWIQQAFLSADGNIWFINLLAGLVFKFDPERENLFLYRTPAFMVYKCILDNTGSFWFACIRNNIFRMETRLTPYISAEIPNSAHVSTEHKTNIIEDNRKRVWLLLNYGTLIYRPIDNNLSLRSESFRLPGGDTLSGRGFSDSRGNLWFITNGGKIIKYDPESGNYKYITMPFPTTVDSGNFPMIREDKAGNIWIVGPRSGLCRIENGNGNPEFIFKFDRNSIGKEYLGLMDFLIDSRGNFWIVTGNALIMLKMPEMILKDYTESGTIEFKNFMGNVRITEDIHGNIWLMNNKAGLFQLDWNENRFKRLSFNEGESDAQYYDLLADRKGRLWISHNKGITFFDPENNMARLIGTQKLQFDIQSYQTKTGHILFINNDRLYIFNEKIPINTNIPSVYVTSILVNGTDYNKITRRSENIVTIKKIDLPFRENSLSFSFAALNYFIPAKNMYRYFLDGFDKDTTQVGPGMAAEYKNLSPGRYHFWVTGSNNDGIWNAAGVTLDIRIHPPWYRSVMLFISYGIMIFLSIAFYIRLRLNHFVKEKERLNKIIDKATAELEHKNRQLAEMDRVKTHFFTDIAHEIRTPLSLITGPLDTISKEEMLSSRMNTMIEIINRNAKRLSNLVNQLLDISKLDGGKMKIILTEGDIIKDLKILLYEFLSQAESKRIKYTVSLPEATFNTYYDRDKTEKIISNLLSNAFKYTPVKGHVHCSVKIETDSAKENNPLLKVIVSDTGPGIESEYQDKIFDRFFRIEGHHEGNAQGTGIGLSLTREFVTLLHGEVTVNSSPLKGSVFIAKIPLGKRHLADDEYIIIQPVNEPAEKHHHFDMDHMEEKYSAIRTGKGKIKLLIIEDNKDLRNFIRDSLSNDFSILEAENGATGINTAFAAIPDIIITDIMMPELDGISLCTRLKNDDRTSHIPVIMLTAKATTENRIEGLKTGADDYLAKPFNMDELRIRVINLIATRETLKKKYGKLGGLKIADENMVTTDERFMTKILKIINARIADHSFGVETLCDLVGMSKRQLTRKLKSITGLTPGTIIRNLRLEKAADYLIHNTGNISEAANMVGLSNPSHFTNSFRKYFGVSPKNYKGH